MDGEDGHAAFHSGAVIRSWLQARRMKRRSRSRRRRLTCLIVDAQPNGSDHGLCRRCGAGQRACSSWFCCSPRRRPGPGSMRCGCRTVTFSTSRFALMNLILRVDRLLVRNRRKVQAPAVPASGSARNTRRAEPGDTAALIESEQKSGVLTVQRPGEVGRMWCAKGRLLSGERTIDGQNPSAAWTPCSNFNVVAERIV